MSNKKNNRFSSTITKRSGADSRLPESRYVIEGKGSTDSAYYDAWKFCADRNIPFRNVFFSDSDATINSSFKATSKGCLSLISRTDTLYLKGHGSKEDFVLCGPGGKVTKMLPRELALHLKELGLQEVGLIKFKSCNVGKGDFLERFSNELEKLGINHGYCSGLTGYSYRESVNPRALKIGKGSFVVKDIDFGSAARSERHQPKGRIDAIKRTVFKALNYIPLIGEAITIAQKEKFHIRVVNGPCAVSFPGSRYTKEQAHDRKMNIVHQSESHDSIVESHWQSSRALGSTFIEDDTIPLIGGRISIKPEVSDRHPILNLGIDPDFRKGRVHAWLQEGCIGLEDGTRARLDFVQNRYEERERKGRSL